MIRAQCHNHKTLGCHSICPFFSFGCGNRIRHGMQLQFHVSSLSYGCSNRIRQSHAATSPCFRQTYASNTNAEQGFLSIRNYIHQGVTAGTTSNNGVTREFPFGKRMRQMQKPTLYLQAQLCLTTPQIGHMETTQYIHLKLGIHMYVIMVIRKGFCQVKK